MDFESECRQIINVIGAVLMQILSGSGPRSLRFSHVDTSPLGAAVVKSHCVYGRWCLTVPVMSPLMSNPWAVDSWCRTILLRAVSVRERVF